MKYMGSKARIADEIFSVMERYRNKSYLQYVEPFVGGANMMEKCPFNIPKYGYDSNKYVIELLRALSTGWTPPNFVTKDEYNHVKENMDEDQILTGWVGVNCSYSGKWFGGYAGKVVTKTGMRNYQKEAVSNTLKQARKLRGVNFIHSNYSCIPSMENSIIYCDPPYAGTTKYKNDFDSAAFWTWVRKQAKTNLIFVSEYEAPGDFECIWEKTVKSSLSANGSSGGSKSSTEKLFLLRED